MPVTSDLAAGIALAAALAAFQMFVPAAASDLTRPCSCLRSDRCGDRVADDPLGHLGATQTPSLGGWIVTHASHRSESSSGNMGIRVGSRGEIVRSHEVELHGRYVTPQAAARRRRGADARLAPERSCVAPQSRGDEHRRPGGVDHVAPGFGTQLRDRASNWPARRDAVACQHRLRQPPRRAGSLPHRRPNSVKGLPVAVEAMKLLYELAFDQMRAPQGPWHGRRRQPADDQVAEVPGHAGGGTTPSALLHRGRFHDAICLGMMEEEFRSVALPRMNALIGRAGGRPRTISRS